MSNTPQTDKLHNSRHETDPLSAYYLMRDLARQLEIEREDALNAWRMSSVCRRLAEERDRLAAALERVLEYQGRFGEEDPESIAAEALASVKGGSDDN
jgi:hypothetical protein